MGGNVTGKAARDKLKKGGKGESQVGRITVSIGHGRDGLLLTYNNDNKGKSSEGHQEDFAALAHGEETWQTPTSGYNLGVWDEAELVEMRSTIR